LKERSKSDINHAENGSIDMAFRDNGLAMELFGSHHSHLAQVEQRLDVNIHARGNELTITGTAADMESAQGVLNRLYGRLEEGLSVICEDVDTALRMILGGAPLDAKGDKVVRTRKRHISARSPNQATYLDAILSRGRQGDREFSAR
jgi:phosphate starvation-inducible PhoH-like protein